MNPAWRTNLGAQASRYAIYPSIAHFSDAFSYADFAAKLDDVTVYEPLRLNIWAPAPRSGPPPARAPTSGADRDFAQSYVDALALEIAQLGDALKGRGRPVAVAFCGGALNWLSCDDVSDILRAVEFAVGLTDSAQLAIDLDPGALRGADLHRLASLGFTQLALAIPTDAAPAPNPRDPRPWFDMLEASVSTIRAAHIEELVFDLCWRTLRDGAPGLSDRVENIVSLAPDRVRVFLDDAAPGAARCSGLAALIDERFCAAGYFRIGVDAYAKRDNALARAAMDGRLTRSLLGFTDAAAAASIGLGASAVSFIDGLYVQNEASASAYMARMGDGRSPIVRGLKRSRRDSVCARAIGDLLCAQSAQIGPVLRAAPPHEALRISAALGRLEAAGIIHWRGDVISMADGAALEAWTVAAAIDPYVQEHGALAAAG